MGKPAAPPWKDEDEEAGAPRHQDSGAAAPPPLQVATGTHRISRAGLVRGDLVLQ